MAGKCFGETWTEECGCRGIYIGVEKTWDVACSSHIEHVADIRAESQIRKADTALQCPKDTTNPKDLVGNKKVSITKLPAVAIIHASHAMMHGAEIYGPFNWREKKVQAEIYIDAALRHINSWNERQETAPDSGVHHLGHAIACLAILLDAQESGNLVDNRPPSNGSYQKVIERLNSFIAKDTAK